MTSKEMRIREGKLYNGLMNEVLMGDDPEVWINRHGMEMSLGIAMEGISNYIEACYWVNDNPLRHLRRSFPDFIWKFHEDVSRTKLASVLGVVDYIWVGGLEVGDAYVTATQVRNAKPRVLCFLNETGDHSGWNQVVRRDLSPSVPGIRFVEDGNDKDANTVIS